MFKCLRRAFQNNVQQIFTTDNAIDLWENMRKRKLKIETKDMHMTSFTSSFLKWQMAQPPLTFEHKF